MHYCGILLEKLSDMPEDVLPSCLQYFDQKAKRNIESADSWYKPGGQLDIMWKEVHSLCEQNEKDFFEKLIESLESSALVKGAGHLADLLKEGIISSFRFFPFMGFINPFSASQLSTTNFSLYNTYKI